MAEKNGQFTRPYLGQGPEVFLIQNCPHQGEAAANYRRRHGQGRVGVRQRYFTTRQRATPIWGHGKSPIFLAGGIFDQVAILAKIIHGVG